MKPAIQWGRCSACQCQAARARLCLDRLLAATAALPPKRSLPPVFGAYTAGDDYFLANYTQLLDYWHKVAAESDRIKLEEIGKTAEGRPIVMAIITSPANFKNLARYKEISQRLARAEGLTDDQARALAAEGKAVVWIDGGLHANEVVPAQALFTETYDCSAAATPRPCASSTTTSSCSRPSIPTAWSWSPTGTCAPPIRSSAP